MFTRATIVVTACLSLLLGGCLGYETDKPIITRDMAIEVPGLEGEILNSEGDKRVLSFDEQSMSYQSGEWQTDGSIEWWPCPILVMPLWDDLYWSQCGPEMQEDGWDTYSLLLLRFDRSLKQFTEVYAPDMTKDEFRQFAEQYRVTIGGSDKILSGADDDMQYRVTIEEGEDKPLSGSRADILAFLMAHADVPLKGYGSE